MSPRLLWIFALVLLPLAGFATSANAQFGEGNDFGLKEDFGDFGGGNLLGNKPAATDNKLELESFIAPATGDRPALLVVRAIIGDHWHVYSLTQKEGGPPATKITVEQSKDYKFIAGFKSLEKPEVRQLEIWEGLPIEEHYGRVTWTAPIEISEGVDPKNIVAKGELTEGQVCHDEEGCTPFSFIDTKFTARLGTAEQIASVLSEETNDGFPLVKEADNPEINVFVQPQVAKAGDMATLFIRVSPQPSWHLYEYAPEIAKGMPYSPTLISLTETSGLKPGKPVANTKVIEKKGLRYYDGPTVFTIELAIPKDAKAGEYPIEGLLGYQICTDLSCLSPRGIAFSGTVQVGSSTITGATPLSIAKSDYGSAKTTLASAASTGSVLNYDQIQEEARHERAQIPMIAWLGMALVAGFVLNFMPCVLPVIGLKVMSFVQQAGEDRKQIFLLNAVYALGMISVFWVLATLAVFANFSWGDQFQSVQFNVALAAIVFTFALSFLGVWEVPIPGFVGSGKASKLAEREGLGGAFSKGVLTTLLATPCTGPLLGPALGWAVEQPPVFAYLAFTCVGLGMAVPYLIIGAQPSLLRFLPKPGAWMETFKNVMGFVLMATVVFILTYIPMEYVVPTVAFIMGLWAACWWVGRKQMSGANTATMLRAWAGSTAFAVLIGLIAFLWLDGVMRSRLESLVDKRIMAAVEAAGPTATADPQGTSATLTAQHDESKVELPWQSFSQEALEHHVANNQTVFVDFTADWCLVCKNNERGGLNTEETVELVEKNGIVTLKADLTRPSPELKEMMRKLGHPSGALPYYAIFPAGKPNKPILFSGATTQSYFLEKLKEAGPSLSNPDNRTAMRPAVD